MIKRIKKRPHAEVNAASMSDIAFLLLIFFLVTTIFALEYGIPMVLPGKSEHIRVNRNKILTIRTHANGAITIGETRVTLSQVRTEAERRLASNSKLVVVLETHPDAEYGRMVDVLDELRAANARRISLREMSDAKNGS